MVPGGEGDGCPGALHLAGGDAGDVIGDGSAPTQRPHQACQLARAVVQALRGPGGKAGRPRAYLDDRDPPLDGGVAQPQVEDGKLFLDVGGHGDDQRSVANLVDRDPRQPGDQVPGQPVPELGVDVVSAQDGAGELGPGVGVLVRQTGPAQDADPLAGDAGDPAGDLG